MGVADGQAVSAAVTNPAFINKNQADTMPFTLGLSSTAGGDGAAIASIQATFNKLYAATGASETQSGTVYGAPASTVSNGDSYQTAVFKLSTKFSPSVGHDHTGAAGDGPLLTPASLTSITLSGRFQQGADLVGVTGGSSNVSSLLAGVPVSTGQTVLGVVTNTPFNKVIIRNSANDEEYLDATGNVIYARVTNSGGPSGTWTLTYYSEISGTETAYSFLISSGVRWYYQTLVNPINSSIVYSEIAFIPSDNVAADIPTATTTTQGKVLLSSTAPPAVGTASAGTANGTVANADHSHAASGSSTSPKVTVYTSGSGTHTVSVSPVPLYVRVRAVGGGGAGGGGGTGGQSANGGGGGSTSFGPSTVANGGGGGAGPNNNGGAGTGGSASVGTGSGLAFTGAGGGTGAYGGDNTGDEHGGHGGSSAFGGGARATVHGPNNGLPAATNSGSGGAGGSGDANATSYGGGGGGAGGYVDVIFAGASLLTSYNYSVGTGGGASGGSNQNGGGGGVGIIIVEEFFQ